MEQLQELTTYLCQFITGRRQAVLDQVIEQRTRFVTVVLENIKQSHNASAVLRSAECLGVQDVHIIDDENIYGTNKKVLKGAHKWLDIHRYKTKGINNTEVCFTKLKEQGYRLYLADSSPEGLSIDEIPISQKIALVFGSEQTGSSTYALQQADVKVHIPMVGFTESFNVSVSAALALHSVLPKVRKSEGWSLSEKEKEELKLCWLRKSIRNVKMLEEKFFSLHPPDKP